jgi:hypothetical protein
VKLVATEVYFQPIDENRCATVGFKATDDSYLLLSRCLQPTEQDIRLGLDGVHVELSDQGFSCYDGIAAVSVFPARIRFDFNQQGSLATHQSHVEVHHDSPPERSWQLRQVLGVVFDGHPRYADFG